MFAQHGDQIWLELRQVFLEHNATAQTEVEEVPTDSVLHFLEDVSRPSFHCFCEVHHAALRSHGHTDRRSTRRSGKLSVGLV